MDGATFQIVLLDETQPQTQPPTRPELPPSPAPARPDFAPSNSTAAPPEKADRPEPVAETRATPANEQADRTPSRPRRSPEERELEAHVGAVREATRIVVDASHLKKAFDPLLNTLGETHKVFRGVVSVPKMLDSLRDARDVRNGEIPVTSTHTYRAEPEIVASRPAPEQPEQTATLTKPVQEPTSPVAPTSPQPAQPPAAKPEPQLPPQPAQPPAAKPEPQLPPQPAQPPAAKPEPQLPPQPAQPPAAKPEPQLADPVKEAKDPPQPQKPAQAPETATRSMWDGMIAGIAKLFDEPGREPRSDAAALRDIDNNTDPQHLEHAASRIVRAIENAGSESEPTAPAVAKPTSAPPAEVAKPVDTSQPSREPEAVRITPQTEEDTALFGKDDDQWARTPVTEPANASKTTAGAESVAADAGASVAVAEAAPAASASVAEGEIALEGAATRAAQSLTRLGPAIGAVGVAAGALLGAFAAVAAAGFLVYKAFDEIGDAAAKQADELEAYSGDIAMQRAQTDVRRQMRLVDRAQERGPTLARVGETKDRLDEAIKNLQDVVTDRFVDLAEKMIPLIEMLISGINTTSTFVETIGTSCGVIEATVIDWLNLLGDEAAEDRKWREANQKHNEKVDKLMGRQEQREQRKEKEQKGDPMMGMLVNAFGPPQAIDPQIMRELVDKLRAL